MLKINRKVEYALIALKYIYKKGPDRLSSAREICDAFNTPFDTTAKVMQVLNSKGVLNSVKGVKGGYHLAKDLSQITYLELCEMIEDKTQQGPDCIEEPSNCSYYRTCNIIVPLRELSQKITKALGMVTLEEMLKLNPSVDFNIQLIRKEGVQNTDGVEALRESQL